MSGNSFGHIFTVTTWGESHGPFVGCTIDGVPAGLAISPEYLGEELALRRPGRNSLVSGRQEEDLPRIVSGVDSEGRSMGTPLTILISNDDAHPADYSVLDSVWRPGHGDYAWERKFGVPLSVCGGGRASGRETAARVAAGAIAKLLLKEHGVCVHACTEMIGTIESHVLDWEKARVNALRCGDDVVAGQMAEAIRTVRNAGNSLGGVVYGEITGCAPGLGNPVFDKLDAMLAHAMFSIGGVKGFEIGDGFRAAQATGLDNNDAMTGTDSFESNHCGGIAGGLSNGNVITFRVAVKPTPSVQAEQMTCDKTGNRLVLSVPGRHDPCIVPRVVAVVEAMAAIVMADAVLTARCDRI